MNGTINFDVLVNDVYDDVVGYRHHIHKNPELSFKEFETSKFIIKELESFGNIEISQLTPTSVLGILKGSKPGKVVALRADIDALPINEESGVEFKSCNANVMHACGHDVHTSVLLGTAQVLSNLQAEINGEIHFIFQHAEEVPPGGARELVAAGVLDDVDYIFGQHVMAQLPVGAFAFKEGVYAASSDMFDISIIGKGGHGAMPNLAIDPVVIASEVVLALQTVVSRKTNPVHPPVISITNINGGGGAYNVIPDKVTLTGGVRTLDKSVRDEVAKIMEQVVKGVTQAHGATYEFKYEYGYPVGYNNSEAYNISLKAAKTFLPEQAIIILDQPGTGSEDFTSYQEVIPGNFIVLGVGNKEIDADKSVHDPKFKADDNALKCGMRMFLSIVEELVL